jgi:hypothetical protein
MKHRQNKGPGNSGGILEQYMEARKRLGTGLSYRTSRLHRLAELVPGLLKSLKIPSLYCLVCLQLLRGKGAYNQGKRIKKTI